MNKHTALLLIDIQNIYFTKGNFLLLEPEKAAANAAKILEKFRSEKLPVIHIKHSFNTDAYQESATFLNDFHESVYPKDGETVVQKNYPNSFLETNLQATLQKMNINSLVVVGMMTHMCIDTTVRACQNEHYPVTVIEDACTTKNLLLNGEIIPAKTVHKSFIAGLQNTFADITTTDGFHF